MPAFDKLKRASFNAVDFPVSEVDVNGGLRDHIHEYPHADGGAPEKMGRKLYVIRMTASFQATFLKYPDLWPKGLAKLRGFFEKGLTADLSIPTIGTIKAYCRSWNQVMNPKSSRSGEQCTFEFVEDQTGTSLLETIVTVDVGALAKGYAQVNAAKALTDFASEADISIFDALANAVNGILAFGDLIGAAGNLIYAKFQALSDLCNALSDTLTCKNMMNEPLIRALHDLWDAVNQSQQNVFKDTAKPLIYVVPTVMSMSQVSTSIYGDSSRTVELLQLNPVEDAFAIPASTRITYVARDTGAGTIIT